jgi:hypothetical protein
MKRLGLLALLLSFCVFTVGCGKETKKDGKDKASTESKDKKAGEDTKAKTPDDTKAKTPDDMAEPPAAPKKEATEEKPDEK